MVCRPVYLLFVLLVVLSPRATAADPPATQPGDGKLPFIQVDVKQKQIRVICEACSDNMDVGLEFFCVAAGTNEYESVLRTKAKASHLHLALLMVGLEPGEPVKYSEAAKKWLPPHGPPLQIVCEWKDPKKGEMVSVPAYRLMRSIKEKKKEIQPLTWIFSGSKIMEDGKYAADTVGYFVSVLNNELSVIDVSGLASRDLESRQLERNADLLPPTGTEIFMIIEPAGKKAAPKEPAADQPRSEVPRTVPLTKVGQNVSPVTDATVPDVGQTIVSLDSEGKVKVDGMTVPIERLKQSLADRRVKPKVKLLAAPRTNADTVGRVTRALNIAKVPFDAGDAETAVLMAMGNARGGKNDLSVLEIRSDSGITFHSSPVPLSELPGIFQNMNGTVGDKWVYLKVDPGARKDVVAEVHQALDAEDIGVVEDTPERATEVAIDEAKVKVLRQKWEKAIAPKTAALREAAQAHYEVVESLRKEQQRLIDEADRIQRVIDQLQKEYSDMTTPRPEGQ